MHPGSPWLAVVLAMKVALLFSSVRVAAGEQRPLLTAKQERLRELIATPSVLDTVWKGELAEEAQFFSGTDKTKLAEWFALNHASYQPFAVVPRLYYLTTAGARESLRCAYLRHLRNQRWEVRSACLGGLLKTDRTAAVHAALVLLDDPEDRVSARAAWILAARCPNERVWRLLQEYDGQLKSQQRCPGTRAVLTAQCVYVTWEERPRALAEKAALREKALQGAEVLPAAAYGDGMMPTNPVEGWETYRPMHDEPRPEGVPPSNGDGRVRGGSAESDVKNGVKS